MNKSLPYPNLNSNLDDLIHLADSDSPIKEVHKVALIDRVLGQAFLMQNTPFLESGELERLIPKRGNTKTDHKVAKFMLESKLDEVENYKIVPLIIPQGSGKKFTKKKYLSSLDRLTLYDSKIDNVFRAINRRLKGRFEFKRTDKTSKVIKTQIVIR